MTGTRPEGMLAASAMTNARTRAPVTAAAALAAALAVAAGGCGEQIPADLDGYAARCVRLNADLLPQRPSDPHAGRKNVYACNVDPAALMANTRPFPAGAVIVKESTRDGEASPWLVATARKQADGSWRWDEYTRNFEGEPPRRIPVPQSKCTGCHKGAQGVDYIFTFYNR